LLLIERLARADAPIEIEVVAQGRLL
jgi:hypothetical protein